MRRVIAGGHDDPHGSGIAFSTVPPGYEGPCRMSYRRLRGQPRVAAFPSRAEASLAATFAVQAEGGRCAEVELAPSTPQEVTHLSCSEWITCEGASARVP